LVVTQLTFSVKVNFHDLYLRVFFTLSSNNLSGPVAFYRQSPEGETGLAQLCCCATHDNRLSIRFRTY